ncbi:uncharacterized protein BXZ73DRAFT_82260 [Epithele typhae]|uniref:uncharacterized protein n=1 Tax=Epithele typhae TaxID=378194 RepID=UPI002007B8F4|nr:uncharacterized protein BXZ73DRAFT_82260 [Epithele typhae]KAH9912637.1 hypothetical protein BXZ73DRAFT_82260 [Epithele typhae]
MQEEDRNVGAPGAPISALPPQVPKVSPGLLASGSLDKTAINIATSSLQKLRLKLVNAGFKVTRNSISSNECYRLSPVLPYMTPNTFDARGGHGPLVPYVSRVQPNRDIKDRPPLGECGPFDGYVASDGFSSGTMFTTPNQTFVPQFGLAFQEIKTFDDGLWGAHELSRWPQQYHPSHIHIACIPRETSVYAPKHDILWVGWLPSYWTRTESDFGHVGVMDKYVIKQLVDAADDVLQSCEECARGPADIRDRFNAVRLCLRITLDRLRLLPAVRDVVFSLAAHVQRLILFLAGIHVYMQVVLPRLNTGEDYRLEVLDVLGAYTNNPSVAQRLHLAGVPVWLQQERSAPVAVYESVSLKRLPFWFSSTPSFPRLVLARRDFEGKLNAPGEWVEMMLNTTHRQLLNGSRLDAMPSGDEDGCAAKRWRGSETSTPGARDPHDAQALAHPLVPSAPRKVAKNPAARALAGAKKAEAHALSGARPVEKIQPVRCFYVSLSVAYGTCWLEALRSVGTLSHPPTSPKYYWPPPWIFDRLDNFSPNDPRGAGCSTAPFGHSSLEGSLVGRVWRAWFRQPGRHGDRGLVVWSSSSLPTGRSSGSSSTSAKHKQPADTKHKAKRAKERMNVASIFAGASLVRFEKGVAVKFGDREVTETDILQDDELLRTLVWEAHEVNWRCELLALDSVVVGSRNWPEVEQWSRESLISEDGVHIFLVAFASRPWMGGGAPTSPSPAPCPADLAEAAGGTRRRIEALEDCDPFEYSRIQAAAAQFYIDTFIPPSPASPDFIRLEEQEFIAQQLADPEVQARCSNVGHTGANTVRDILLTRYMTRFNHLLPGEPEQVYLERQKRQRGRGKPRRQAETEAEMKDRMTMAGSRILNHIKAWVRKNVPVGDASTASAESATAPVGDLKREAARDSAHTGSSLTAITRRAPDGLTLSRPERMAKFNREDVGRSKTSVRKIGRSSSGRWRRNARRLRPMTVLTNSAGSFKFWSSPSPSATTGKDPTGRSFPAALQDSLDVQPTRLESEFAHWVHRIFDPPARAVLATSQLGAPALPKASGSGLATAAIAASRAAIAPSHSSPARMQSPLPAQVISLPVASTSPRATGLVEPATSFHSVSAVAPASQHTTSGGGTSTPAHSSDSDHVASNSPTLPGPPRTSAGSVMSAEPTNSSGLAHGLDASSLSIPVAALSELAPSVGRKGPVPPRSRRPPVTAASVENGTSSSAKPNTRAIIPKLNMVIPAGSKTSTNTQKARAQAKAFTSKPSARAKRQAKMPVAACDPKERHARTLQGAAALRRMTEIETPHRTPLLLLTGSAEPGKRKRKRTARADGKSPDMSAAKRARK